MASLPCPSWKQQRANVHVSDAVTVSRHEHRVVAEPAPDPLESAASLSVQPGIDNYSPAWRVALMDSRAPARQIDRDAVVERVELRKCSFTTSAR